MALMMTRAPMLRCSEITWDAGEYLEKRQLFLRSYHFSRKRTAVERMRGSLVRVRRLIWVRLRSARRLPRLVWFRLRSGWPQRRRRFHRLVAYSHPRSSANTTNCWSW